MNFSDFKRKTFPQLIWISPLKSFHWCGTKSVSCFLSPFSSTCCVYVCIAFMCGSCFSFSVSSFRFLCTAMPINNIFTMQKPELCRVIASFVTRARSHSRDERHSVSFFFFKCAIENKVKTILQLLFSRYNHFSFSSALLCAFFLCTSSLAFLLLHFQFLLSVPFALSSSMFLFHFFDCRRCLVHFYVIHNDSHDRRKSARNDKKEEEENIVTVYFIIKLYRNVDDQKKTKRLSDIESTAEGIRERQKIIRVKEKKKLCDTARDVLYKKTTFSTWKHKNVIMMYCARVQSFCRTSGRKKQVKRRAKMKQNVRNVALTTHRGNFWNKKIIYEYDERRVKMNKKNKMFWKKGMNANRREQTKCEKQRKKWTDKHIFWFVSTCVATKTAETFSQNTQDFLFYTFTTICSYFSNKTERKRAQTISKRAERTKGRQTKCFFLAIYTGTHTYRHKHNDRVDTIGFRFCVTIDNIIVVVPTETMTNKKKIETKISNRMTTKNKKRKRKNKGKNMKNRMFQSWEKTSISAVLISTFENRDQTKRKHSKIEQSNRDDVQFVCSLMK